jgi:transketolase
MPTHTQLANAIRALSMDAVQQAKSGHPGMPMGMADIATVLWREFLQHNPNSPHWINRDRFVLSNGHGSMLMYSLLHLSGYDLTIEDLKNFRQMGSKTPGHPEYGYTEGVETTTGPLGQGLANAIGMAMGEKILGAHFNRDGHEVIDHHTYTFLGDGCLMEGISHEVCSLAGTWGLGKLTAFWDDNNISIDGEVGPWFSDDTPKRFEAYGWHVIADVDGHNPDQIRDAIKQAHANTDKPTLICCKTTIGFGSPNKSGKASAHGAPLGEDEIKLTREALGWTHGSFEIPEDIYAQWSALASGDAVENVWHERFDAYQSAHPELAGELVRRLKGGLPHDFDKLAMEWLHEADKDAATIATRKASQIALNKMEQSVPEFVGGSADLAGSNLTIHNHSVEYTQDTPDANYINYGVREFGMTAIANGLALYGGFVPYTATFLVFSDYCRNAIRMAAIMKLKHVFVYTHDSIGLGEDGPTHQPVEHVPSLRLIPNLSLWRPADAVETQVAWSMAAARTDGPTALILSRQNLPHNLRKPEQLALIAKGGYTLCDCGSGTPDIILLSTGSELALAKDACKVLRAEGKIVRVVSMPCADIFDAQDKAYKDSVLVPGVPVVAIEAASTNFWYKYVGLNGAVVGMDTFGESAPAGELFKHFGFTVEAVVKAAQGVMAKEAIEA